MRCPKGRALRQSATGEAHAGGRVDARDLEGVVSPEWREKPGEPGGEHGLARTGGTHEQQMVSPGGGHLECASSDRLTSDVSQIGTRWQLGRVGRASRSVRPRTLSPKGGHELAQAGGPADLVSAHQSCFDGAFDRDHHPPARESGDHGHDAGNRPEGAVKPELADEGGVFDVSFRHRAVGHQDTDGDGQVEPGPPFSST